ncbi:MAG: hypothetical protein QW745_08380 [Thermoplasmata archaeon]
MSDAKTIWHFRELLSKTGKDKAIWKAILKQLEIKEVKNKNGTIQDATLITSDPGHGNYKKQRWQNKISTSKISNAKSREKRE